MGQVLHRPIVELIDFLSEPLCGSSLSCVHLASLGWLLERLPLTNLFITHGDHAMDRGHEVLAAQVFSIIINMLLALTLTAKTCTF